MQKKKYSVNYKAGSTNYGWSDEYDSLEEFEYFINDIRKDYTGYLTVWDRELEQFIFWKDAYTYDCYIDMLSGIDRDFKTTKKRKNRIAERK